MKGYAIYDLQTHEVFVSKHVNFHEPIFPYKDGIKTPTQWQYTEPGTPIIPYHDPATPDSPKPIRKSTRPKIHLLISMAINAMPPPYIPSLTTYPNPTYALPTNLLLFP